MPLYGVSMVSFGLLIFVATARPRRCAALASSNAAALEELPSRVAPSCMVFTVSLPRARLSWRMVRVRLVSISASAAAPCRLQ
jgi:hypothetical protein